MLDTTTTPALTVLAQSPKKQVERLALKRRFPTAYDLRARARRRLPNFAFEYLDGGAAPTPSISRKYARPGCMTKYGRPSPGFVRQNRVDTQTGHH